MTQNPNNIPQMLAKLDALYAEEETLIEKMRELRKQYDQLQEDKELLQKLIMYTSNKLNRG